MQTIRSFCSSFRRVSSSNRYNKISQRKCISMHLNLHFYPSHSMSACLLRDFVNKMATIEQYKYIEMHEQIANKTTTINSRKNSSRYIIGSLFSLYFTSFSICMQFKDFLSTVKIPHTVGCLWWCCYSYIGSMAYRR